jgi:hypothetical protein
MAFNIISSMLCTKLASPILHLMVFLNAYATNP